MEAKFPHKLEQPLFIHTFMNESKSFSAGYFSLPMKTICSKKCAKPGMSSGSLKLPAPMQSATAA